MPALVPLINGQVLTGALQGPSSAHSSDVVMSRFIGNGGTFGKDAFGGTEYANDPPPTIAVL